MRVVLSMLAFGAMLWAGLVLDSGISEFIQIFGARPEFVLIILFTHSLLWRPMGACFGGFFAGVFQGALVGANLTHYVISRAVGAFALSGSRALGYELNSLLVGIVCGLATVGTRLLFMFLAPPASIPAYLGATIGSGLYNGLIAIPLFALLRRLYESKQV